jgi:hypothetical protein
MGAPVWRWGGGDRRPASSRYLAECDEDGGSLGERRTVEVSGRQSDAPGSVTRVWIVWLTRGRHHSRFGHIEVETLQSGFALQPALRILEQTLWRIQAAKYPPTAD